MHAHIAHGALFCASLVSLLLVAGCSGGVVIGTGGGGAGGSGNGASGSTSTLTQTGGGAPVQQGLESGPYKAVAMTQAQLVALSDGPGGSTSAGSGATGTFTGIPPNAILVFYGGGTGTPSCSEPTCCTGGCTGWNVDLTIYPEDFVSGNLIKSTNVGYSFYANKGGQCVDGAGYFTTGGQIQMVDITDTTVHLTLSGSTPNDYVDPNGDITAVRCPEPK